MICSLCEGDYHLGVAVLLNSFIEAGFKGLFWIGYRGQLPPWTSELESLGREGSFRINEGIILVFEKLETSQHLTNYKPAFMLSLVRRGIALDRLCYFDPDIVNECSWSFYRRWLGFGVALCEEAVNGTMPHNHPLRLLWAELMRTAGYASPQRQLDRYYNGGFVGVTAATSGILELWQTVMDIAVEAGLNTEVFMTGSREQLFYASDQDALNVAAMYFEGDLSTIGPEGMGFSGGGFTMHHATASTKPWRRHYLREALQGKPPLMVDKRFLACAAGPLHPFPPAQLRRMKRQARIALGVGRFYRRP